MTFLNTIDCSISIVGNICFWILFCLGLFLTITTIVDAINLGDSSFLIITFFGILLIILAIILGIEIKDNKDKKQYEVLIDKDTPFVEVIENYNFIEQRGDIYILEDK